MTSKKTIGKSKLIKLLSTFSSLEWKRFGRFVQSPYHNTNQQVIDLYTILKKAFPFEVLKDLEQERIYKKVYGTETFKLSKFQNLCSDVYELASDFMIDVHLDKEKRKKKKLLIDALSERNYELFRGASQQLIKEVETQEYFLDEDDFLLLFELNDKLHYHIENDTYTDKQTELEKMWRYLDAFYEIFTTQLNAETISAKKFINLKKTIADDNSEQLKVLFEDVIILQEKNDIDHFYDTKEKILKQWNKLKQKHKFSLLVHLLNFSFTNDLIQKEFGHREALALYKIGIKDKLFIINGKMRDAEFLNISMIGFKYESKKWSSNFIEAHKKYLPEEISDFLVPLAYAYQAISQNDYKEVIHLISNLKPINKLNYLEKIKKLLIRAYYEGLNNGDENYRIPLMYEMESLNKMVSRNNKSSIQKKEANVNFLKIIKKLIHLSSNKPYSLQQVQSLELLLSTTSPLILKSWLQQKLIEIKNATSI